MNPIRISNKRLAEIYCTLTRLAPDEYDKNEWAEILSVMRAVADGRCEDAKLLMDDQGWNWPTPDDQDYDKAVADIRAAIEEEMGDG